eukprot:gene7789-12263_t
MKEDDCTQYELFKTQKLNEYIWIVSYKNKKALISSQEQPYHLYDREELYSLCIQDSETTTAYELIV